VPDARGVCVNCPAGGGSGPSEEELRRKRAAKVLSDQAEDAYDDGVVALKRGDYAKAVKYFAESLEYAPDDEVTEAQLKKAKQALADSQAKSTEFHSSQAAGLANEGASMEARKGFDTGGQNKGSLDAVVADPNKRGDPAVPADKRTPKITDMERQRTEKRNTIVTLEAQIKTLDPKTDAAQISKIKQAESTAKSEVQYLNFSINAELQKPSPDPARNVVK